MNILLKWRTWSQTQAKRESHLKNVVLGYERNEEEDEENEVNDQFKKVVVQADVKIPPNSVVGIIGVSG
jgi:hypothetical protein